MSFDKHSQITSIRTSLNETIVQSISTIAGLSAAIQELTVNPGEDSAAEVDAVFAKINDDLLSLRNGITVLANVIVSDNGEVEEISARPEENGLRLL